MSLTTCRGKSPMFQSNEQKLITQQQTSFFKKKTKHLHPPLMLVMGGTCQLKWESQQLMPSEPDARSGGRWTSSLHRSADDETNAAALDWTNSVKGETLTASPMSIWTLWAWNAVQFKRTEGILHKTCHLVMLWKSAGFVGTRLRKLMCCYGNSII